MKPSTALALAIVLSAPFAAHAQTEQPTSHRRHPVHHHHHSVTRPAPVPTATAERPGAAAKAAPPETSQPFFKPYAHPGEGDNDRLSRDPDDCMKGCIGGNPG